MMFCIILGLTWLDILLVTLLHHYKARERCQPNCALPDRLSISFHPSLEPGTRASLELGVRASLELEARAFLQVSRKV